ncbi:MAG: hypothetical protein JWN72_1934 [Thermoleophilia bacterium]|nr:hypothetical protein [Thermoleophilia bacterium]
MNHASNTLAARRAGRPHGLPVRWLVSAIAALLLLGALTAAGWSPTGSADAASTDNVVVTATSTAAIAVSNGCAGVSGIAVSLGSVAYSGACTISYGATNDATQKLTLVDNDGAAPFQGTIPNTAADCAALGAGSDQAGVHITGTANNSSIMAAWATACTAATTAGTNAKFRPVPAAAVDACTSVTTSVVNHQCSFEWGVSESGSDLPSGTYVGTAKFTVVDI